MNDYEDRLQRCFSTVFPQLGANEIRDAAVKNVPDWDSIANINLLCVVEEEFEIEITAGELGELTSFRAILQYLETHNNPAAQTPHHSGPSIAS